MKIRGITAMLVLCAVLLSFVSCAAKEENPKPEGGEVTTGTSTEISLAEKSKWKEKLVIRITEVLNLKKEGIERLLGVGLIDVNLDGTPEVAMAYPGGSSGNTYFELVDLNSGKNVGYFNAGPCGDKELGELSLYIDRETNSYMYIGQSRARGGWQIMSRNVYTIALNDSSKYAGSTLFSEVCVYTSDSAVPDATGEAVPDTLVDFFVRNTRVTHEDYYVKLEKFWQKVEPVAGTDFICMYFEDSEGKTNVEIAEAMADSLINSTQVFVKGGELPK